MELALRVLRVLGITLMLFLAIVALLFLLGFLIAKFGFSIGYFTVLFLLLLCLVTVMSLYN